MTDLLLSPTAFKGTLRPFEASALLAAEARRAWPRARVRSLPLADGGDGTLDVLEGAWKGRRVLTRVRGPLGTPVTAAWSFSRRAPGLRGPVAVIEMARASGLALVRGKNRILEATTFGTGELIRAALDRRCRTILIGVGGTATGDGGAGALEALGYRFYDAAGRRLSAAPRELSRIHRLDRRAADPRLKKTRIVVLCDVTNPLLGARGSARTFGPQKGATPAQVRFLEKALRRWSRFAKPGVAASPGAGAAGALAFGLAGFAGATLAPGAPYILNRLGWPAAAKKATWIVTGEGKIDRTSFYGKVIGEIVRRRGRSRVAAVCGSTPLPAETLRRKGLFHVETMGPAGLKRPAAALKAAAARLFRALKG